MEVVRNEFVPTTTEEQEKPGKEWPADNYDNPDGLSHRCCLLRTVEPSTVRLTLGGQERSLVFTPGDFWKAVDLLQPPSILPQRVWYLDERSISVKRDAYVATFSPVSGSGQSWQHCANGRRHSEQLAVVEGFIWGGRRVSNPRPPEPQSGVLPLNYAHHTTAGLRFANWKV
jgi:hypothetical protein